MRTSIASYRQNGLAGVEALTEGDPHRRVAVLYQGLMERLDLAVSCSRLGDRKRNAAALNVASNILTALRSALDHKVESQIPEGLDALYEYGILRLLQANIDCEPAKIIEVRALMEPIVSAWNSIAPAAREAP